jgi:hypothetical protein
LTPGGKPKKLVFSIVLVKMAMNIPFWMQLVAIWAVMSSGRNRGVILPAPVIMAFLIRQGRLSAARPPCPSGVYKPKLKMVL